MLNSSGTPSGTLVGSGNLSKTGGSTKAKSQCNYPSIHVCT